MMLQAKPKRVITIFFAMFLSASLWSCGTSEDDEASTENANKDEAAAETLAVVPASAPTNPCAASSTLATAPTIDCAYLPDTFATGVIDSTSGILDYDMFAWDSFIAMNWPVAVSQSGTVHRGIPDLQKSFSTARSAEVTVWESLKEKREVFLFDEQTNSIVADPQPAAWNAPPAYGTSHIPMCAGSSTVAGTREMVQATKQTFDNLDETAEVASEAREANAALCAGHSNTDPGCDGNSTVEGSPVGPRIYYGQPKNGSSAKNNTPVVYEVKVNYDFYKYLETFELATAAQRTDAGAPATGPTPLWVQNNAVVAAGYGLIRLPVRTSGSAPGQPGTQGSSAGINSSFHPATQYSAANCYENNASAIAANIPCSAGSVHLKAAWIDLAQAGIAQADWSDYHTATGFTYRSVPPAMSGGEPTICKATSTLGLVGLHIIQRIHQQNKSKARGGTFIFATWEHATNDQPVAGHPPYNYANLYPTSSDTPQPYPQVTGDNAVDALPLSRYYDLPANVVKANTKVHSSLNCGAPTASVWCNYNLIGTQYAAIDTPASKVADLTYGALPTTPTSAYITPGAPGQPHYLANLVIESNLGLQQFQGLPPGINPIDHFANPRVPPGTTGTELTPPGGVKPNPYHTGTPPVSTTTPTGQRTMYDVTADNIAFRIAPQTDGKSAHAPSPDIPVGAMNMGGCMGCHGVAQVLGYSFSFVLLGNQQGAAIDTQLLTDIPPKPNVVRHN